MDLCYSFLILLALIRFTICSWDVNLISVFMTTWQSQSRIESALADLYFTIFSTDWLSYGSSTPARCSSHATRDIQWQYTFKMRISVKLCTHWISHVTRDKSCWCAGGIRCHPMYTESERRNKFLTKVAFGETLFALFNAINCLRSCR